MIDFESINALCEIYNQVYIFVRDYYQEIILAAIPAIINSYRSFEETNAIYTHLPFLKLHTYVLFWAILFFLDFVAVCLLFWWLFSLSCKPGFYSVTLLQSLVFGFSFINISRLEKVDLLVLNDLNFNNIYLTAKQYLYTKIEDHETNFTADFWNDLKSELESKKTDEINELVDKVIYFYNVKKNNRESNNLAAGIASSDEIDTIISKACKIHRESKIRDKVVALIPLFNGFKKEELKKFLSDKGHEELINKYQKKSTRIKYF